MRIRDTLSRIYCVGLEDDDHHCPGETTIRDSIPLIRGEECVDKRAIKGYFVCIVGQERQKQKLLLEFVCPKGNVTNDTSVVINVYAFSSRYQ